MVGVVAAAAFVTMFCLVASKAVFSQNQYQGRVTKAKEAAHKQLQDNLAAFDTLVASYKKFDGKTTNIIGGNKNAAGDNDGTNSKIILDALPSSYDFPALTSSLEKILKDRHLNVTSISGTDDQLAQQSNTTSASPTANPIPFTFGIGNANYTDVQNLVKALQSSIRPMAIDSLDLSGGASNMTLNVNAHTYYQPGKSVNITTKVVK
jgi:hypothetical protein